MEIVVNQMEQRSWTEINLDQIKRNYLTYKNNLRIDMEIMAVVKADAYGHGDVQIARLLTKLGCKLFAVSNIDEAVGLRNAGIEGEILILGYTSPKYARTLSFLELTQTIVSEDYARVLCETGLKIKCQFAIDTGMNRIGLDGDNPKTCSYIIHQFVNKLQVEGVFTHLCMADINTEECRIFTQKQIKKFSDVALYVKDLNLPYIHCCNSAGGLHYLSENKGFDYTGNIVRLGIVLYGLKPDASNTLPDGIKPALVWKTVVSMVKNLHIGENVSYGCTFKADHEMCVATVTTGYADGLCRILSNKGFMIINGQKAPIIGRICMDQTMLDVTNISNVKMGNEVIILGESGNLSNTADDMAKELDTIGYEVVCDITKRVQRFYKLGKLIYTT